MIFSQYSGSSARLTSTRPLSSNRPSPKSVTSQRGFGGRAQPASRKADSACRIARLISERFMNNPPLSRRDRVLTLHHFASTGHHPAVSVAFFLLDKEPSAVG